MFRQLTIMGDAFKFGTSLTILRTEPSVLGLLQILPLKNHFMKVDLCTRIL